MNKDLFQYQIRVSPRAKNSRLNVTLQHGLEVVIPRGYDQTKVPGILSRNKEWIKAALERVELNRKLFEPEPEWQLPTDISLPAIGQKWRPGKQGERLRFGGCSGGDAGSFVDIRKDPK